MADAKYIDLMAKYLTGNLSSPERTDLLEWAESSQENRQFFDEMVQLWSLSGSYEEEEFEADVPAAWSKLDKRIEKGSLGSGGGMSAKVIPLSRRFGFLRIAVAILLLVVAGFGWMNGWFSGMNAETPQTIAYQTAKDENKEIQLPDGSVIQLNENTLLSYQDPFDERIVELEGEAFFDVMHLDGKPFVIISGDTRTKVLGTSFNVRAYPEEEQVEVTVETGKVAFGKQLDQELDSENTVLLEAGTSGVFDRNQDLVSKIEGQLDNANAWRTKLLKFDDVKLEQITRTLERYFDTTIIVNNKDILNCKFTYEDTDPKLKNVLESINFSTGLSYQQTDNGILIEGEGCQ